MHRRLPPLLYIIILTICFQCEQHTNGEFQVVTEDIIYVSGEVLRSTGRVISIGDGVIDEHGFIISDNPQFLNPVYIQLGNKKLPGRFVGQTKELLFQTEYFCKAFLVVEGDTVLGNLRSFSTLEPSIEDYGPGLGLAGQTMIINGKNLTEDTRVLFNDTEAEIVALNFESEVVVKIPEIENHYKSRISIKTLDRHLHFADSFEYIFGKWEFIRDFPAEEQRSIAVYFKNDDKFIFGLGWDGGFRDSNVFWSMDLNTFERNEIPYDGPAMRCNFFNNGYFGAGIQGQGPFAILIDDFWKYDQGEFEKLGSVPFNQQICKAAFTVEGALYVVGGQPDQSGADFLRQVWKFDELTSSWILHDHAPIEIFGVSSYFVDQDKAYFVASDNQVWSYEPMFKNWEIISTYPGQIKQEAFNVVVNNRAYIGLQGNDWTKIRNNETNVWEFNLNTYEWKIKVDFPGNSAHRVNAFFTHDDLIYVMRYDLRGAGRKKMELWSFDPMALK